MALGLAYTEGHGLSSGVIDLLLSRRFMSERKF